MGVKITSVSLPEDVWEALKKVENRSQYITNLIRQDLNKTPKALTKQDVLNIVQQYLESNQIEPKPKMNRGTEDITLQALREIDKIIGVSN